jgi:predicted HTH transcriptional regulator
MMTKEELLKAGEWNDIEFKEARTSVPKSAFETVSAFANPHGGWLVFGVSQHGGSFDITGVEKSDRVQNDFRDGIQFWNPGDVFGDDTRLLEPGEKEVRNPGIIAAMRRITMCEQAGTTGMRMMREEWQDLGHPAPTMKNDRAWKAFELFIPELDKEVDMASDLMKAMFSGASQVTDQVGTKSAPS